jgi:hypothetical protein
VKSKAWIYAAWIGGIVGVAGSAAELDTLAGLGFACGALLITASLVLRVTRLFDYSGPWALLDGALGFIALVWAVLAVLLLS